MNKKRRRPRPASSLQLALASDTHELHRELDMPAGDILLYAGDFSMFSRNMAAVRDFNEWLGELPYRRIVVVPGNHESFLEKDPALRSLLSNATVLINESCEIEGLNIWGSPVTSGYFGAFSYPSSEARARLYGTIPPETDILITHSPPAGILDRSHPGQPHVGCPELLKAVQRLRPKLHLFGHVHSGFGVLQTEHTLFVNAALLGPHGDIAHQPVVVSMNGVAEDTEIK